MLGSLDPERTAAIFISKTFGTQETLLNGAIVRDWLGGSGRIHAVSANPERAVAAFGIDAARVLEGVTSGGVTLNGTLLHIAQDSLPFGGIGPSGMGAYHGQEGLRRFSHARSVFKVGPINVFERLGPPWTGLARRMFGWLAR